MPYRPHVTRAGVAAILVFSLIELVGVGGLGAWLAVQLHFPYAMLTPVAFLVYGAAGFHACHAGTDGWIAGAAVAILDAGSWAAFGGIGPQPSDSSASVIERLAPVLVNAVIGAVCGVIGARASRRVR